MSPDTLQRYLKERYPVLDLELFGQKKDGVFSVSVSFIRLPKEYRGRGYGSVVFDEIFTWADAEGICITLTPSSVEKEKLVKYYKRLGFVEKSFTSVATYDTMVRLPRCLERVLE